MSDHHTPCPPGLETYRRQVYDAVVRLGHAGAAEVARLAGLPLRTADAALRALARNGTLHVEGRNGARRYSVHHTTRPDDALVAELARILLERARPIHEVTRAMGPDRATRAMRLASERGAVRIEGGWIRARGRM